MRDISSIHALFIGVVKGFMKRRRTLACTENTAFCKINYISVTGPRNFGAPIFFTHV